MSQSPDLKFSSAAILEKPFATHKPRLAFNGESVTDWRAWREKLLPELWERFGPFPDKAAPLNPQLLSTQRFDAFTHRKVVYYSREDAPISASTVARLKARCEAGQEPGGRPPAHGPVQVREVVLERPPTRRGRPDPDAGLGVVAPATCMELRVLSTVACVSRQLSRGVSASASPSRSGIEHLLRFHVARLGPMVCIAN